MENEFNFEDWKINNFPHGQSTTAKLLYNEMENHYQPILCKLSDELIATRSNLLNAERVLELLQQQKVIGASLKEIHDGDKRKISEEQRAEF